jgi:thiamine pyrophosphate-dependent acetolactate synthase large subunit-like protein
MRPEEGTMQSRAQAMAALLELLGDQPVIICNGFPSREAFKIADRPTHFYMIGSMGVAAAIGLGVALSKPDKQVVVFDGDGNGLDGHGHAGHDRIPQAEKLCPCGLR